MTSREAAEYILEKTHVVTSPGSAFGACGEGHMRISYTTKPDKLAEAFERLKMFCEKL